jgi:hypothetical protein
MITSTLKVSILIISSLISGYDEVNGVPLCSYEGGQEPVIEHDGQTEVSTSVLDYNLSTSHLKCKAILSAGKLSSL